MKFSAPVIAVLLGYGGLVCGRPQEVNDVSANVNLFTDEVKPSADELVAFNTDGSAKTDGVDNTDIINDGNGFLDETGQQVDLTAKAGTGISTDQTYNIGSPEKYLGISAKAWEDYRKILEHLRNGELIYSVYQILEGQIFLVKVLASQDEDAPRAWLTLLDEMTEDSIGYAIYHYKTELIPLFFAWTNLAVHYDEVKKMAETFVDFNRALGLGDTPLDLITNSDDYNNFLKRIGQTPVNGL